MECVKDYQVVVSTNGKVALVLPAGETEPGTKPEIVYNGGNSALLYRSASNVVVLDNLHEKAQQALRKSREAVVVEADYATGLTVYDYPAAIVHNR